MEKLGNWFAIAKKWEYLVRFSVSARADQSTGFSVNGSSTPNGLFHTINGLFETAPSVITWYIVPFKSRKSWTFC